MPPLTGLRAAFFTVCYRGAGPTGLNALNPYSNLTRMRQAGRSVEASVQRRRTPQHPVIARDRDRESALPAGDHALDLRPWVVGAEDLAERVSRLRAAYSAHLAHADTVAVAVAFD